VTAAGSLNEAAEVERDIARKCNRAQIAATGKGGKGRKVGRETHLWRCRQAP
jgi:hypothetical protein